jgi:hypothetical protein
VSGLDRGWPRRALVSPPYFGRTLPPLWLDTPVAFYRKVMVDDGHGGFSATGAPDGPYLAVMAACDYVSHSAWNAPEGLVGGLKRSLRFYITIPEDPDLIPRRGDEVDWTSDIGVRHRIRIDSVESAAQRHDHLTILTEALE